MLRCVCLLFVICCFIFTLVFFSGKTTAASDETCSFIYEGANYSGREFSVCSNSDKISDFYPDKDIPFSSINSIKIATNHALELCKNSDGTACYTYYNSVDNIKKQTSSKFKLVRLIPFKYQDFYMAFMSDTQYPWSCKNASDDCDNESKARLENNNHIASLNALRNNLGKDKFVGVVINGDLTAFGHKWQLTVFKELYGNKVQTNIYLGLGNHDIENNVDDCFENFCATRMALYLRDHTKTLNIKNFDYYESDVFYEFPSFKKKYSKSLAYSWDIGNIHFVQLNNYPTYTAKWDGWNFSNARRDYFSLESAQDWLIKDLEQAREAGKHIILNYHNPFYTYDIKDILRRFKVSAIFAGHIHHLVGLVEDYSLWNFYGLNEHLPVFLCGSAVYQKYLLVNFKKGYFEVSIIKSNNGANYKIIKQGVYKLY